MFQIFSAFIFILIGGSIYWAVNRKLLALSAILKQINDEWEALLAQFRVVHERPGPVTIRLLRKLLFLALIVLFIILVFSAFIPALIFGIPLSGLLLILHVTAAPFFVICLMFWVLLQVHSQSFTNENLTSIRSILTGSGRVLDLLPTLQPVLYKLIFWLALLLLIPAMLSVILSMYPLFDTETMAMMADVHRYCGLALVVLACAALFIRYINSGSARMQ
jgi:cytochrome b561